jgi:L-ornithine Nalpha-acyltransferase
MSYMLLDTRTMILAQRNGLTVRLALTPEDVRAAQRLRYQVFYEELGAVADVEAQSSRFDIDRFDGFCDHLLVIKDGASDTGHGTAVVGGNLVGTYRLLRQDVAERNGGFYTESEFDLEPLLRRHKDLKFLEVGRSCVAEGFRDKPVAELLWQGIWNYVRHYKLDVMLGCASLAGVDADLMSNELTFLSQVSPAPLEWQVAAVPTRRIAMRRKPMCDVNQKAVLKSLPTLVKAYLRLGCYIGDGAVIDHQFNTTDILIVLPVSAINPRYFNHYGAPLNGDHLPTS